MNTINDINLETFNFYDVLYDGLFDRYFEDHLILFNSALNQWTERPLLKKDFNELEFKFYDGIIGYVISQGNSYYKKDETGKFCVPEEILNFFNIWKYNGSLFRVIDTPKSRIRFHKMISSWTKSVNSFYNFNHLYENKKYSFLIAKTNDYFGFDVNKYREYIGERHTNTECEEEIIFPMDKKYITDVFYGTLTEFKNYIETNNKYLTKQ